jgi:uncharacterized membrane protein (UPF0127 family)
MAWLVKEGQVLASLEIADSRSERRRGLLGRDSLDGAFLISPARSVHSFGMRFDLDVALVDSTGRIVAIRPLPRRRVIRPRRHVSAVVEARRGAFAKWQIQKGDLIEFRR